MRGRLIVVEGLDGVGKSTFARDLSRALGAMQDGTPGAELREVRQVLDRVYAPCPLAGQLFYASSVVAAGLRARILMDEGHDVVMDRYWGSTVAYGRARGCQTDLTDIANELLPADYTILLTLDPAERMRRLHGRGMTDLDRDTLDPAFASRVSAALRRACTGSPAGRLIEVDCTGHSRAELVELAVGRLAPRQHEGGLQRQGRAVGEQVPQLGRCLSAEGVE